MNAIYHLFLFFLLFGFQSVSSKTNGSIYETFLGCLANQNPSDGHVSSLVYNPTNSSYTSILQAYIHNKRFKTSSTPKPVIIATPLHETHVQSTIICTKNMGMNLRIRSGGHDFEGLSYVSPVNFVLLDMSNLRSIDVDIEKETATVQVGATIGELYYKIWENSKVHAFPAGVCPSVGIGGHISGGGYGVLMRKYGLTIDNVIDATIIDVNGRVLNKKLMGEDLFWAIRGGGGANFGVILSYKLKLVRVPETVTVFRVSKTHATDIVSRWQHVANKIDRDLFIRLTLQLDRTTKTIEAIFTAFFLGNPDRLVSMMNTEFPELGIRKDDCKTMSWVESVVFWWTNNVTEPVEKILLERSSISSKSSKIKSDYLQNPIPGDGIESLWRKMEELRVVQLAFNPYGGRMNEIKSWETPYPHRAGTIFKIQYLVVWDDDETEAYYLNQIRVLHEFMTPFVSKNPREAFLNYRDLDLGTSVVGNNSYKDGKVYGEKYFMGNFDRLVKVKTMVDGDNFFTYEQSIPTSL
ncbi:hypothetical protein R6Q59_003315 [Mikania micrantha]